jgi:hypothetical protein
MVSFDVTPLERSTIAKIVERAEIVANDLGGLAIDRLTLTMDITACHANGNPLRLDELFGADRFDFIHDVFGICRNIDRDTGKLGNFFSPRFSRREPVAA